MKLQQQRNEKAHLGWIQHLLTTGEAVFIPFVCRKCGKCCREVSVDPHYFDPFAVADYLNLSVREVVQTYFGEIAHLNNAGVEWKQTKAMKPCVFLKGNKCSIYAIRPDPCRSFPVSTDFGDCGIGCPGRSEYVRARKKLGKGIPYDTEPYREITLPGTRVRTNRWEKILHQYLSTNPCKDSSEVFIRMNNPAMQKEQQQANE